MTTVKTLYSETLPSDLQDVVRSIPADEGVKSFRTHATSYDESGKGWVNYDVAWQNKTTGLWTLETYKAFLNEGEKGASQKKTVARNVSFFDALYHCAFSETARVKSGEVISDQKVKTKEPHYIQAANAAKQPIDTAGLPHPAVDGRILTDGIFDDDAQNLAQQTEGVVLLPVAQKPSTVLVDFSALSAPDISVGQHGVVTDKLVRKEQMVAAFEDAKEAAGKYKSAIKYDINLNPLAVELRKDISINPDRGYREFMTGVGVIVTGLGVLFTGIAVPLEGIPMTVPLVVGAAGAATFTTLKTIPTFCAAAFNQIAQPIKAKALDRKIKALPECGLKAEMQNFQNQIKAAHHFAKAATYIERHGYGSHKNLKRAFAEVDKGAKIAGMSAIEAEQLRMAITQKKFPSVYEFERKMGTLMSELGDSVKAFAAAVEKADDVPALEHAQELPLDLGVAKKLREPV